MTVLIVIVQLIFRILVYALFGRAILSWFVNPYTSRPGSPLVSIYSLLVRVTEWLVAPFRKFFAGKTGSFDFSVMFAWLALSIAERVVLKLLQLV